MNLDKKESFWVWEPSRYREDTKPVTYRGLSWIIIHNQDSPGLSMLTLQNQKDPTKKTKVTVQTHSPRPGLRMSSTTTKRELVREAMRKIIPHRLPRTLIPKDGR